VKFECGGNDAFEAEVIDEGVERDDVIGEAALEKLPRRLRRQEQPCTCGRSN